MLTTFTYRLEVVKTKMEGADSLYPILRVCHIPFWDLFPIQILVCTVQCKESSEMMIIILLRISE